MSMESDHTPEALPPPTTDGEDNLTQPSSGEQPTSVQQEQGVSSHWIDLYGFLKTSKDDVERMAYYINQLSPWNLVNPGTGLESLQKLIATKCAEDRRQAKIPVYSWLGVWRDKLPSEAVTQLQDILERGENNE